MRSDTLVSQQTYTSGRALSGTLDSASALANANIKHNYIDLILSLWMGEGRGEGQEGERGGEGEGGKRREGEELALVQHP